MTFPEVGFRLTGMDNNIQGGTDLGTLLLVLFIGLKLGGVISWSWWWVLSPLWLPFAIIIPIAIVVGVIIGFAGN